MGTSTSPASQGYTLAVVRAPGTIREVPKSTGAFYAVRLCDDSHNHAQGGQF
jgi:hypothetical protein